MDTIFEQIMQNIQSRLEEITADNGYNTNIGSNVFRGISTVSEAKIPFASLDALTETPVGFYDDLQFQREIRVGGVVNIGTANPSQLAEQILGDIREAMEGDRITLNFENGDAEISVGDTVTGASSGATGFVQAVSVTAGTWAGGDAQGTLTLRRVDELFTDGESITSADVVGSTYTNQIAGVTGDLAVKLEYQSGGTTEYPEDGERVAYTECTYNLTYRNQRGNPYST
jgi:hypothetical protein